MRFGHETAVPWWDWATLRVPVGAAPSVVSFCSMRGAVCVLILGFCQSCRVSKGYTWLKNSLYQWHFHEKLNVRNTDKISVHKYRFVQTDLMDLQKANSQSLAFGREWTRLLLNIIQRCFYFWLAFLGNFFKAREISLSFPSTNMI